MDQVYDRFGRKIEVQEVGKQYFRVTMPVNLSTTFYSWVFQYVGKMKNEVLGHVRKTYPVGYLEGMLDETPGG